MSLRHLVTGGATTLGMTLLQATATIAREHQLPEQLARTLANLTAFAIADDAAKAVEVGCEAVTVGRRSGVLRRVSVSALNLAAALLVRGDWRELTDLLESSDIPWERGIDETAVAAIEALLAQATGRPPRRPVPGPEDTAALEGADLSWVQLGEAARLVLTGSDDEALTTSVAAVEGYGERPTTSSTCGRLAMELATKAGDRAVEEHLLTMVDSANIALPLGLRAHRARAAGLIAVRDGELAGEAASHSAGGPSTCTPSG